jgi:hypothetical protein
MALSFQACVPGQSTAAHISHILTRLTAFGALFLGIIAVLPIIVQNALHITSLPLEAPLFLSLFQLLLISSRKLKPRFNEGVLTPLVLRQAQDTPLKGRFLK